MKTTCDNLGESERAALDTLKEGIVGFAWLGFNEEESEDRFIAIHFHIADAVHVLRGEDRFVDPAGYYMD